MREPLRVGVRATQQTGLEADSAVMVDKASAVSLAKIGPRIGELDRATLRLVTRGLASLIGLARPS